MEKETRYFDNDFNYEEWAVECSRRYELQEIGNSNHIKENLSQNWEEFYKTHDSGQFFKGRKYLAKEFQPWLENCHLVLEVGCGYGCSIYPLMESFPSLNFIATDYSETALTIFQQNRKYDKERIIVQQWDFTLPSPFLLNNNYHIDAVFMIFALSAVHPSHHVAAMTNLSSILPEGSYVFFRDYGLHDMTMYRHSIRHNENLFERSDGTLSYYFDLESFLSLAQLSSFTVVEIKYATVINRNRKSGLEMRRVFLHAVLRKQISESTINPPPQTEDSSIL